MKEYAILIGGRFEKSENTQTIKAPWNSADVAKSFLATEAQVERALQFAHEAFKDFRRSSRFARVELLKEICQGISERRQDLVQVIVDEAGKPRKLAAAEVDRALTTFTLATEECKRFGGELIPLDFEASATNFGVAESHWIARGPVLAISPFNFPLNLVAHKIAPALAVGASVILKPPPQAPGASQILGEIFLQAMESLELRKISLPRSLLQIFQASNEVMQKVVKDERVSILSFTGSDRVGFFLQQTAVKKKALLELGGNAAVIVNKDADLLRAAQRIAFGAYAYAGQVCISVQRIFVETSIAEEFKKLLLSEISKIKSGDPSDADVINGPMIDSQNADRIDSWVKEATQSGGRLLAGGERIGNVIQPILLENVPKTARVSCEEVFGPVAVFSTFNSIDEAIQSVNASRFGLQAGIFTNDSKVIQKAIQELEVGGILINEIPTYRSDQMPYGGSKDSGIGREGVRYTMMEYCEPKVVVRYQAAT